MRRYSQYNKERKDGRFNRNFQGRVDFKNNNRAWRFRQLFGGSDEAE